MKREELEKALVYSGWTYDKNSAFRRSTYWKGERCISLYDDFVEQYTPLRNIEHGRIEFCLKLDKLILSNEIIRGEIVSSICGELNYGFVKIKL